MVNKSSIATNKKRIPKKAKSVTPIQGELALRPYERTYKPEFALIAYELALLSFGTARIAKVLCVPEGHVKAWRENYDEFRACIQTGGDIADGRVAKSLYQRAIGYDHTETKIHFDKLGNVSTHDITKHIPPDVGAALGWLKIRQKDIWNIADKIEHLGNVAIIAKDEADL
jgi:hypothetical protein